MRTFCIFHLTIFRIAVLAVTFQIVSTTIFAQVPDTVPKPKIGLVLSGGGAKGLAHIGVLRVMEEAGIKPDIITGTSMGSIVGSLYAIGYSADELSDIIQQVDWEQLLTDNVLLPKVAMEEKQESNKYLFQIPIKDRKISLPSGLIEGQHLENYFSKLFWPLTEHESFDSLPIPFHCMSVDIISGKTIEHKSGDIVKSIRASMSIPTVFSPVHMDSMLLIDGGVIKNFPVQEAIDMGADIIIGVYVGFEENVTIKEMSSLSDVLMRSTSLAGIADAKIEFPKVDLLIVPELKEFGAGDFGKSQIIEQIGEDAARKQFSQFKALADSLNLKFKETPKLEKPKRILIKDIEVENLQHLSKSFVISKSGIQKGDYVSYENINEAIEFMYGTQQFKKLTFSLKKEEDGNGYILVFHVKESPRILFKLTFNYDDDLGTGLVTDFTFRNVILPSSRMIFTLNIAENPGAKFELNKLLGRNQRFSNQFFANIHSIKLSIYNEGNRLGNYNHLYFEGGYGIHYSPGLNHQFGGNIFYKYNNIDPKTDLQTIYAEADFHNYKTRELGYHFFYKINTTDDLYFPKSGSKLKLCFTHVLKINTDLDANSGYGNSNYFVSEVQGPSATLSFDFDYYKTFGKKITFNMGTAVGLNSDNVGVSGYFLLGGSQFGEIPNYINYAGYNFGEIYTPNFTFIKSGLNIEILSGLYLSGNVNMGNLADSYSNLFSNIGNNSISSYYWGFNTGFKYNSMFGPIQLLFSDNNKDDKARFHFSIGFPF